MIVSSSNDCPHCGSDHHSKHCFIVYEDGYHCFSCGAHNRKSAEHYAFRERALRTENPVQLYMPENTTNVNDFSVNCLKWLASYYVYTKDIQQHRIAYCPPTKFHDESLIYPVLFDEQGNVTEYQRRFFPKNFFSTSGLKKTVTELRSHTASGNVVLVEDYISYIRVGKYFNCICMFGTSLNQMMLEYITNRYQEVAIWLDEDKAGENATNKIAAQLKKAFECKALHYAFSGNTEYNIHTIFKMLSPKENCDQKIKDVINCVRG